MKRRVEGVALPFLKIVFFPKCFFLVPPTRATVLTDREEEASDFLTSFFLSPVCTLDGFLELAPFPGLFRPRRGDASSGRGHPLPPPPGLDVWMFVMGPLPSCPPPP